MRSASVVLVLAALALVVAPRPSAAQPLRLVGRYEKLAEIPIGGEGGWDYLSVDAAARRLYVVPRDEGGRRRHRQERRRRRDRPAPGVHGIALAPELGRGFMSNGRESTVSVVDLKTLADRRHGQDRREPGRDPVRPGPPGGLHLQRARQVGHGLRRADGRGPGDHPAPGQAGVRGVRREGRPGLQRHRGHEPGRGDRHHVAPSPRPGRSRPARRPPAWRSTRRATGCSSAAATS